MAVPYAAHPKIYYQEYVQIEMAAHHI